MQKQIRTWIAVMLISLFAVGCASNIPETVIVKQTVISEKPVTVEVKETVIVEVPVTEPAPEGKQSSAGEAESVTLPDTESFSLHASSNDRDYNITVSLPPGYAFKRIDYPVVYLLDGHINFTWVYGFTRFLVFDDLLPEMIIVGIDNSIQRGMDLNPDNEETVKKFLSFIQQDLIPYVEQNYRTKPDNRILVGGSYGGKFALYTLFTAADSFDKYIANTPNVEKEDVIFRLEAEYAASHTDLPVRLFMSRGEREPMSAINELIARLESRNYPALKMEFYLLEDGTHYYTLLHGLIAGMRSVFLP